MFLIKVMGLVLILTLVSVPVSSVGRFALVVEVILAHDEISDSRFAGITGVGCWLFGASV